MRYALLCGLACLSLLGWAASAQATPAHRDAVLGATDEWIGSVLHVPVADRADLPGGSGELGAGQAEVPCDKPGEAHYDPDLLEEMTDRRNPFFREAWETVLHEHGHLLGGPCVYLMRDGVLVLQDGNLVPDPEWVFFEEGFVDAVRIDMAPAFFWRMFGMRLGRSEPMPQYRENVAVVRALSRWGSGSRTWRDRAAREWRRAGLVASWPERQVAIAAANARRGGA